MSGENTELGRQNQFNGCRVCRKNRYTRRGICAACVFEILKYKQLGRDGILQEVRSERMSPDSGLDSMNEITPDNSRSGLDSETEPRLNGGNNTL